MPDGTDSYTLSLRSALPRTLSSRHKALKPLPTLPPPEGGRAKKGGEGTQEDRAHGGGGGAGSPVTVMAQAPIAGS